MKNFSNYNDYSTKEELHFESKAVHGALGTEPLTGAVSMPIFQTATFRHPELGESTGFAYSRLENKIATFTGSSDSIKTQYADRGCDFALLQSFG